jgi:hypothetical protein
LNEIQLRNEVKSKISQLQADTTYANDLFINRTPNDENLKNVLNYLMDTKNHNEDEEICNRINVR